MSDKSENEKIIEMEKRIIKLEQELENERRNKIERKLLGRRSKADERLKIRIMNRRREGATIRAIAEEYNLSIGSIHKIIKENENL